jgi:hypothetical protein
MSCQRCQQTRSDAADSDSIAPVCEAHSATALAALRQAVHARSIQSADAASDETPAAPIRAAWIIT